MAVTKRPRTKTLDQKQSVAKRTKKQDSSFPFLALIDPEAPSVPVLPPLREHATSYHRPALLDNGEAQKSLLSWFNQVSKDRDMPWRQQWIDPKTFTPDEIGLALRETLKRRAYQVWVSEIMLQQTRVETVRAYYQTWHTKWPTIEDLAKASPEDVLSAWRGLGYYSRATRLHTAAKTIVNDPEMDGMLPELPAELEARVPGVGRYTAGAVSSIVFGHAVPILDGNVMRVLARQMGVYANMSGKAVTSLFWEAADILVKEATWSELGKRGLDREGDAVPPKSDIPSFWNQALMELGSTVCKPQKPDCKDCPIRSTCLAYAEGKSLAQKGGLLPKEESRARKAEPKAGDIEDLCMLCEQVEDVLVEVPIAKAANGKKKSEKLALTPVLKQSTLSFRVTPSTSSNYAEIGSSKLPKVDPAKQKKAQEMIEQHVTLFPLKTVKKAQRKEECLVCVIKVPASKDDEEANWLIEQRPNKGLLASLWQFPSLTIAAGEDNAFEEGGLENGEDDEDDEVKIKPGKSKAPAKNNGKNEKLSQSAVSSRSLAERERLATKFADTVLQTSPPNINTSAPQPTARHLKELGSITHLFSHIRLVMHVHVFEVQSPTGEENISKAQKNSKQEDAQIEQAEYQRRKWARRQEVEDESLGTGMRRCWALALKEEDG